MTWIRSSTRREITICAQTTEVQEFLQNIADCARLMPDVESVEQIADDILRYRLEPFSNGAVSFTPDYQTRFDMSDPGTIRWYPHGEHNFRSRGAFRVLPGAVPGESLLEIAISSEADVDVDPILQTIVEPFAQQSTDLVT